MDFLHDPRGDLPPPNIQLNSYSNAHRRGTSYGIPIKKPKKKQCYDWIFSSASNIHVAVDRGAFKTYVSFKSYVLTVAGGRQIPVQGMGTVEIKIRRAPGSRETHPICLENVLHVPDWLCNVISDIHFVPAKDYEHTWTEFGVNFFKREKGTFRPWGYTENFCGLDRLVLSRNPQGRSPMLEDPDREVFSVSLTWPQSQKDKWNDLMAREIRQEAERIEKDSRKKGAEDEAKGLRREVKSNLTEATKWKLMPAVTTASKRQLKSEIGEIDGEPEVLPRGSSLLFERSKA